jgi:flagellar hook-associated protein 3 FlgL
MRVTQSMISANVLQNLNKSYAELDKYFNQLNTGKKINRPSDDPVAAINGMGYRTELSRVEQYQRNASEIHSWHDNSDAALEQITSGLQRVRYLAVQASNGTYDNSERENIAEEVKQIRLDLIEMANMKVNDKYIFNGTDTENPPIRHENGVIDYENSNFNSDKVAIEVSSGTYLDANVNGGSIFGELTGEDENLNDLFSMLDGFIEKLNNNDADEDLDESINDIDNFIDGIINRNGKPQ